jgi:hypothetical protein
MNEKAIQILKRERQRILDAAQKEVEEIDRTIANLQSADFARGSPDTKGRELPQVRPGQYSGMPMREALQVYLNERKGGPVATKRAAVELALAGVELGKKAGPERHERNLKIMISNNSRLFRLNEGDGTVSLSSSSQDSLDSERMTGTHAAGRKRSLHR